MIQLIDLASEEIITSTESDKLKRLFFGRVCQRIKDYALNVSKEGFLFYSDNFELKEQTATEP